MAPSGLVAERILAFQAQATASRTPGAEPPVSRPVRVKSEEETSKPEAVLEEKLQDISEIAVETSQFVQEEEVEPVAPTENEPRTTSPASNDDVKEENSALDESNTSTNLVTEVISPLKAQVDQPKAEANTNVVAMDAVLPPVIETLKETEPPEPTSISSEYSSFDEMQAATQAPPPPPPVALPERDDDLPSVRSVHSTLTENTDVVSNKIERKPSCKKVTFERSPDTRSTPPTRNSRLAQKLKKESKNNRSRRRPKSPQSLDSGGSYSSAGGGRDIMDAIFDYFDAPADSDEEDASTIFSEESSRISSVNRSIERTASAGSTVSLGVFPVRSFDEMWESLAGKNGDKNSDQGANGQKTEEESNAFLMFWDFLSKKGVDLDALCAATTTTATEEVVITVQGAPEPTTASAAQARASAAIQQVSQSLQGFVEQVEAANLPEKTQHASQQLAEHVRFQIERNFSDLSFDPPLEAAATKSAGTSTVRVLSPARTPDSRSPVGVNDWQNFNESPFKIEHPESDTPIEPATVAKQLFQEEEATLPATPERPIKVNEDVLKQSPPVNRASSLPAQATYDKLAQPTKLRPSTSFKVAPQTESLFSAGDDEFQNFDAADYKPTRIDV